MARTFIVALTKKRSATRLTSLAERGLAVRELHVPVDAERAAVERALDVERQALASRTDAGTASATVAWSSTGAVTPLIVISPAIVRPGPSSRSTWSEAQHRRALGVEEVGREQVCGQVLVENVHAVGASLAGQDCVAVRHRPRGAPRTARTSRGTCRSRSGSSKPTWEWTVSPVQLPAGRTACVLSSAHRSLLGVDILDIANNYTERNMSRQVLIPQLSSSTPLGLGRAAQGARRDDRELSAELQAEHGLTINDYECLLLLSHAENERDAPDRPRRRVAADAVRRDAAPRRPPGGRLRLQPLL